MNHFNPEILASIKSEVANWTPQEVKQRFLDVYSRKDKANERNGESRIYKNNIFAKWELKKS
jgi:hypothetical protein